MSENQSHHFDTQVAPLRWVGTSLQDGYIQMLDQRLLPQQEVYYDYRTADEIAASIKDMVIRGAPAIGIAAAYGVFFGVRDLIKVHDHTSLQEKELPALFEALAQTRPTAVNLFWALDKMKPLVFGRDLTQDSEAVLEEILTMAHQIMEEDRENNLTMGRHGAALMPDNARILTHCNTGGLATGGYGTALGVIRAVHAEGRLAHVWVDETRPYLQGARLTAWECMKDELPSTLITDNMAAYFMQQGKVDAVIVGADRISADGSAANKIGTYGLAVLCKHHNIPFYVAAPLSTIDLEIAEGRDIPIEQRSAREVTHVGDRALAPEGMQVAHPAFDVTPGELITAIVTEKGVVRAPYNDSVAALFED